MALEMFSSMDLDGFMSRLNHTPRHFAWGWVEIGSPATLMVLEVYIPRENVTASLFSTFNIGELAM